MRLSATLAYANDPQETVAQAVEWERAGVDILWVPRCTGSTPRL